MSALHHPVLPFSLGFAGYRPPMQPIETEIMRSGPSKKRQRVLRNPPSAKLRKGLPTSLLLATRRLPSKSLPITTFAARGGSCYRGLPCEMPAQITAA